MRTTVVLVFALVFQPLLAQQSTNTHWAVSYFHQDVRSSLELIEIRFADERHGVAVGWLAKAGRPKMSDQIEPAALMTADGGKSWNLVPLKSRPRSLFFLGAESCWMTAADGLWKSTDGGKSFKKISGRRFRRVHFLDSQHGFAVGSDARQRIFVGAETAILTPGGTRPGEPPVPRLREDLVPTRQLLETRDGGLTWKEHPVSKQLDGAFVNTLEFAGQRGAAVGRALPRTGSYSTTTVLAKTGDGGATWTVSRPALPGLTNGYRLAPGGAGYALVWLGGGTPAVYRTEAGQTGPTRVFADPDLAVTDLAVLAGGSVWLAAVACPPGGGTVPGGTEVQMLYSESWNVFEKATVEPQVTDDGAMMVESPVRANTVVLTSAPGGTIWAATDTGIILKLERD